jgi:hypothetical protein
VLNSIYRPQAVGPPKQPSKRVNPTSIMQSISCSAEQLVPWIGNIADSYGLIHHTGEWSLPGFVLWHQSSLTGTEANFNGVHVSALMYSKDKHPVTIH